MKVIGHRGAAGLAPANSLAAIKKALQCGAQEIEVDVHATKDNVVVLLHDPKVGTGKGHSSVSMLTLDELQRALPGLATLEAAIGAVGRKVPLRIDIKDRSAVPSVVTVVSAFLAKGWQPNDFVFAAFDANTLSQLQLHQPGIPIVINERWSGIRALLKARRFNTRHIAMNKNVLWPGAIIAFTRLGYQLDTYTLNAPERAHHMARYGLAGVITDRPDRLIN